MKEDSELVEDFKNGDIKAFSQLVDRHQKALLRLAMRFVKSLPPAEEIVQESFVKAYRKIHLFEGRSSFKNWLFQITANTAKNKLRSMKSTPYSMENVEVIVQAEAQSQLEHNDLTSMINKYIDVLPEKQRTALVLRIFEDLSFKEIAEIMDCPYDTAKANYRHALMKLKKEFQDNETLRTWKFQVKDIVIKSIYSEVEG